MNVSNFVLNDVWGVEIAVEMTFLAVGSFSIVLAFLSTLEGRRRDALIGGILGVVFPLAALVILNLHLLKPEAAYLVFTSFQPSSWMAIGAVGIVVLLATSAIFTVLLMLTRVASRESGRVDRVVGRNFRSNVYGFGTVLRERNTLLAQRSHTATGSLDGCYRWAFSLLDHKTRRREDNQFTRRSNAVTSSGPPHTSPSVLHWT